jgi:hypothetical protein
MHIFRDVFFAALDRFGWFNLALNDAFLEMWYLLQKKASST